MRRVWTAKLVLWVACVQLASCSSLHPYFFSPRLTAAQQGTQPTSHELEVVYKDVADIQRQYLSAITEQGNATPLMTAALLGLAGFTLYRGTTSPNSHVLTAASTTAATTWALGANLLSKPRLEVYRAGALALSCAMAAVEPLRRANLGKPTDDENADTLYGAIQAVFKAKLELELLVAANAHLMEPTTTKQPQNPAPQSTTSYSHTHCDDIKDPIPIKQESKRKLCRAEPAKAVTSRVKSPSGPASNKLYPAPELMEASRQGTAESERAEDSLKTAQAAIGTLGAAGGHLWHTSVRIQLAVSRQVDQTVPDITEVLKAANALNGVSTSFTGLAASPGPAIPKADAQSKGNIDQLKDKDRPALKAIQEATHKLLKARLRLEGMTTAISGLTDGNTQQALNACSVQTTGIELKVSPASDILQTRAGDKTTFFVSGGTGVPSATVEIGPKVDMPVKVDGGQFRFEYAAPADLSQNEVAVIRFQDGTGVARHYVKVVISKTPTPAADAASVPSNADVSVPVK